MVTGKRGESSIRLEDNFLDFRCIMILFWFWDTGVSVKYAKKIGKRVCSNELVSGASVTCYENICQKNGVWSSMYSIKSLL